MNDAWTYSEETLEQCRARYDRFGIGLFERMEKAFPELFHCVRYYRATERQTEDVYAVCSSEHPFAIQLDPDCEVICLCDEATHVEIGTWSSDPEGDAIQFIRENFRQS